MSGCYGSFLFTFSLPLLWQLGIRAKTIASLGFKKESIRPSLFAGSVAGITLGLLGGIAMKGLGISGRSFSNLHKLSLSLGSFEIAFPLQDEVGYRLLGMSHSFEGLLVYLLFSIFIIGLGEELFWRAFVQQKIAAMSSKNSSIWITAALFSLSHFYIFTVLQGKAGILFLGLTAIAGAVWGYIFERFGNIGGAAASHGITAFIIWKYYFFGP